MTLLRDDLEDDVRALGYELDTLPSGKIAINDPHHGQVAAIAPNRATVWVEEAHQHLVGLLAAHDAEHELWWDAYPRDDGPPLHGYDIPARRVDPHELEPGDVIAAYSPPNRDHKRCLIQEVNASFRSVKGKSASHHQIRTKGAGPNLRFELHHIANGILEVRAYVVRLEADPRERDEPLDPIAHFGGGDG